MSKHSGLPITNRPLSRQYEIRATGFEPTGSHSAILHGLGSRGPADVSDFVMAVVVDAVEAMLRRGFPSDVVEEFLKRLEQEPDTTTAVISEALFVEISTTLFCAFISLILGGDLASD